MNLRQRLSALSDRTMLVMILFIALVVRLLGVATRLTYYDEAFAILFAEKGPAAMLKGTLAPDINGAAADIHPLGYYTMLWGWMKVFGESLVSVRLLSILLGLGTVLAAYFLLRAMFTNPRLALLGTLGVALSPFQVHYSQQIRMYALLTFALSVATYAFWKGMQSSQRRWWVLFAICAALAAYTQNLAAFYLVPLALTPVLLRRWDKVKMTILAGVGALLLYLPWLLQLPAQLAKIQNAYWVERPTLLTIFTTLLSFVTNLPVDPPWIPLALIVALLVPTLAAYQTFLAVKTRQPGMQRGLWLAYMAFAPGLLMFIVSQWKPVYIERALLCSAVMFWLWMAWALTATNLPALPRMVSFALLAAGIVLGVVMHITYSGFPYGPYQTLDASLRARAQSGDMILHSNKLTVIPAIYFDRSLEQGFIGDPPGSPEDTLAPATQKTLGIQALASLETATANTHKVWFVIFQEAIDEAVGAGLATHPDIAWLDAHFQRESVETWGSVLLYVYKR